MTAAPSTRHQHVVVVLTAQLYEYSKGHGGRVFPAPTDVYFTHTSVVEPDVVFVRRDHIGQVEKKFIRSAPDIVVEVSSPSTRRLELLRKRELYERFGVPEYWYVDVEADRVEIYRLREDRFAPPMLIGRGDHLTSPVLPDLVISVDELLGPPEEGE